MSIIHEINEVFFVYENADSNEGRGPMVIVHDSGFFTSETEAWKFANTLCGVMGRRPIHNDWRKESYPDVQVKRFVKHDSQSHQRKIQIMNQIDQLQKELKNLS